MLLLLRSASGGPVPPTPPFSTPQFGLSTHFSTASSQAVANQIAQLAVNAGITVVRDDAAWSVHEPTSGGGKNFGSGTPVNRVLTACQTYGLKVILMAGYAPSWANGGSGNDKVGPTTANAQRYGDYVRALAAYCEANFPGVCFAIEYWNEPNIFFLLDPATGAQATGAYYTNTIAKTAWNTVRGISPANTDAAPNIELWAGATSGNGDGSVYLDYAWVNAAISAGIVGYYNGWSIHPYNFNTGFTASDLGSITNNSYLAHSFFQTTTLVSVLAAAGDTTSKVHATEWGAPTFTYPSGAALTGGARSVSESTLADGWVIAWANWQTGARAGHFLLYTAVDDLSSDTSNEIDHYGAWHDSANSYSPKAIVAKFIAAHGGGSHRHKRSKKGIG